MDRKNRDRRETKQPRNFSNNANDLVRERKAGVCNRLGQRLSGIRRRRTIKPDGRAQRNPASRQVWLHGKLHLQRARTGGDEDGLGAERGHDETLGPRDLRAREISPKNLRIIKHSTKYRKPRSKIKPKLTYTITANKRTVKERYISPIF